MTGWLRLAAASAALVLTAAAAVPWLTPAPAHAAVVTAHTGKPHPARTAKRATARQRAQARARAEAAAQARATAARLKEARIAAAGRLTVNAVNAQLNPAALWPASPPPSPPGPRFGTALALLLTFAIGSAAGAASYRAMRYRGGLRALRRVLTRPDPVLAGMTWPPPGTETLPGLTQPPGQAADDGPPPELVIRVLGRYTVNGDPARLLAAQSSLLLALALHGRDGLSHDRLRYLLGRDPDLPKPAGSLRHLIVRTRRQLGQAPGGREWIEHAGGGHYILHEAAWFDLDAFETLAAQGLASKHTGSLRDALELVRSAPFSDCCHWWLDVGYVQSVRAQVTDVAALLAAAELEARDAAASARAARKGLEADPAAEELYRALMRAEHAKGSPRGVEDAWRQCTKSAADMSASGLPDPQTITLYRQLTR